MDWELEQAHNRVRELEEKLATHLRRRRQREIILKRCHELIQQGLLVNARWKSQVTGLAEFTEQVGKHRRKLIRSLNKPVQRGLKASLIEQCPPEIKLNRPRHRPTEILRKFEEAVQDLLTTNGVASALATDYTAVLLQLYNPHLRTAHSVDGVDVAQRLRVRRSQAKIRHA